MASTYVALLRGINLGARNRVAMPELKRLVEALGGETVQTYLQSGNAVFRSAEEPDGLKTALERGIRRSFGLEIEIFLFSGSEIGRIARGNPFAQADPATLHVTFLAETPGRARVDELAGADFSPDTFRVVGREIYLSCPGGYGRTKLSNAFFERRLRVVATTRNWKTVTAVAQLAAGTG